MKSENENIYFIFLMVGTHKESCRTDRKGDRRYCVLDCFKKEVFKDISYLCDPGKKEHYRNMRPEIAGKVENFDESTDIMIGYPAWWYTCPMIMLILLEQYDFTGKNVHLFNIHMGSGSMGTEDVRKHCKGNVSQSFDANILIDERIKSWLG